VLGLGEAGFVRHRGWGRSGKMGLVCVTFPIPVVGYGGRLGPGWEVQPWGVGAAN